MPDAVIAALPQTAEGASLRVGKDARLVDDCRLLRRADRDLDHVDAEERGVGVLVVGDAARELLARSDLAGARTVDVDVAPCPSDR